MGVVVFLIVRFLSGDNKNCISHKPCAKSHDVEEWLTKDSPGQLFAKIDKTSIVKLQGKSLTLIVKLQGKRGLSLISKSR